MSDFLKKNGYTILLGLVILLGVLLRLKGLLINPSMWHDECALGWNIKFKNYSDFFGLLRFMQMAPPFFMVATKLITNVFGISDMSLRVLPFLIGSVSIIAFYFLADKLIKSKSIALWAVFFFAINQQLVYFSYEFKPYNCDVLFTIICLLLFINLDIEKLDIKKVVFYGISLALIPWFSFASTFIIAGGMINLLFKNIKSNLSKKIIMFIPLLISGLIYLKIYLINNYTGTHMVAYWHNHNAFLNANPMFFFYMLIENIKYFFYPMPYILLFLFLFIWGIRIFYKEKTPFISISAISFILLVIASYMHFYPFAERLIIFLLPIFLLLVIKPLDLISLDKKIKLFVILILAFFTFYPQIVRINSFVKAKEVSKGEAAREMVAYLTKNIKKDDIIFVSNLSNTEFAYYSSFYNMKNQVIQEPTKSNRLQFLNSIKKGKYCWFYITFKDPKLIVNWIDNNAKVIKLIHPETLDDCLIYAYLK